MKCPRCSGLLESTSPRCAVCDFALPELFPVLGKEIFILKGLSDEAHCLRVHESRSVQNLLQRFHDQFPQVHVAIMFAELPSQLSIEEISFWLLNHIRLDDAQKNPRFTFLMLIDPANKAAAINYGYALEGMLDLKAFTRCLTSIRTQLWHGEYPQAIEKVVTILRRQLLKSAVKKLQNCETAVEMIEDVKPRISRNFEQEKASLFGENES